MSLTMHRERLVWAHTCRHTTCHVHAHTYNMHMCMHMCMCMCMCMCLATGWCICGSCWAHANGGWGVEPRRRGARASSERAPRTTRAPLLHHRTPAPASTTAEPLVPGRCWRWALSGRAPKLRSVRRPMRRRVPPRAARAARAARALTGGRPHRARAHLGQRRRRASMSSATGAHPTACRTGGIPSAPSTDARRAGRGRRGRRAWRHRAARAG